MRVSKMRGYDEKYLYIMNIDPKNLGINQKKA
jgi:hypothetical protein